MRIIQFSVQPNGDIYVLLEDGTFFVRKSDQPEMWFPIEGPK